MNLMSQLEINLENNFKSDFKRKQFIVSNRVIRKIKGIQNIEAASVNGSLPIRFCHI